MGTTGISVRILIKNLEFILVFCGNDALGSETTKRQMRGGLINVEQVVEREFAGKQDY
jgi:hypothetical protein